MPRLEVPSSIVDLNKVYATANCARCGLVYHKDLVKQMEYTGDQLVWTGQYVCPDCLSEPNPQFLTPHFKEDPEAVRDARPYSFVKVPEAPRDLFVNVISGTSMEVKWEAVKYAEYYVVYWTDTTKTKSLLDFNQSYFPSNLVQNPYCYLDSINPYEGMQPNCDIKPNTTYLIQVASLTRPNRPLRFKGNYQAEVVLDLEYNISQPTNIQYALSVTTGA